MKPYLLIAVLLGLSTANAQERGLTPEWDIRAVLKEISAHAGRLVPVLEKCDPARWTEKDASESYLPQWRSCKAQAQALSGDALELTRNPERLPVALKVFFRMQSLEFSINSLGIGIRKYQNPAMADMLASVAGENGANRERFQQYIVELAGQREEEYKIMDHEAQRCRDFLARQPAPAPKKPGRK